MDKICSIDNLLIAYFKAQRAKRQLPYVIDYSKHLFENILRLRNRLLSGDIELGRYRYFQIYDPKLRKICAAAFEERVVHHAIINVCHPYFERHFIFDTYATRLGKGSYAAIDRARIAMRHYEYVAKLDVKSYLDSISHNVLKKKLQRIFKDERVLVLLNRIIDSYSSSSGFGIPIGNLTSQYFANYYLSFLDHYAKEVIGIRCYLRYMDDVLLFASTKAQVKEYVRRIQSFVDKELHLNLKQPVICPTVSGVSFLGYSLSPHKILLNRRSKIRLKRKMAEYTRKYADSRWTEAEYRNHIVPLIAFAEKAYTKGLRSYLCKKTNS
ncbi:MAG: RNA-directed DNA polymerase [Candidatus Egerieousia sp.]